VSCSATIQQCLLSDIMFTFCLEQGNASGKPHALGHVWPTRCANACCQSGSFTLVGLPTCASQDAVGWIKGVTETYGVLYTRVVRMTLLSQL
jgi:hypothetical protein